MHAMGDKPAVLIVDDLPDNIQLVEELIKDDYEIFAATNGERALRITEKHKLDAILLDVMMPGIDGFEVCRRLKEDENTKNIPIIFLTARSSHEDILKGMEMGALYYLTKPLDSAQLIAVISTATENFGAYKTLKDENSQIIDSLSLIDEVNFRFQSLTDVHNLSVLVANVCPSPERSLLGLKELMLNAVEHGNLNITYDEKSELNNLGKWKDEVERRLMLPENKDKFSILHLERDGTDLHITIRDQGEGFDWQHYMEMDPERAFDNHGRGIAMANALSFDQIAYLGKGNEVMATIRSPEQ